MKNLNMSKKVVVAFSTVIICFLFTIIFCIMGMNTIGSKYDTFFHVRHEATLRARSMRVNLQSEVKSIVMAAVAVANGEDDSAVNDLLAQSDAGYKAIESELTWFQTEFDGDISLLNNLLSMMGNASPLRTQIISLIREGTPDALKEAQEII